MTDVKFVADTSVWIDYLSGRSTPQAEYLDGQLAAREFVGLTDIVLTELLQGTREAQVKVVEARLAAAPILRLGSLADFRRAAAVYRAGRQRGLTIRRTTDCLIAAVCIRDGVPILHSDRDFDHIAAVSELRTVPISGTPLGGADV